MLSLQTSSGHSFLEDFDSKKSKVFLLGLKFSSFRQLSLPQTQADVKKLTLMMGEPLCESILLCNQKTFTFLVALENIKDKSAFSTITKSKIDLAAINKCKFL